MAGETKAKGPATGKTLYYRILGSGTSVWSTSGGTGGFESYQAADWTSYNLSMTEEGASNVYVGNFPAAVPAGVFDVTAHQQLGGSPAESDPIVAAGEVNWNATQRVPLSDLATSGQVGGFAPIRLARGVQVLNFPFKMVSSADHVTPLTSGVVSGQIARDGGAFGALQSGAFTEMGLGWFKVQALTSGDLLANTAALVFTAAGVSGGTADQRDFALILQRTSGQ